MQDPDRYLKELGVKLAGWMNGTQSAVLDPAHRSLVNQEAFFFADPKDKKQFDDHPQAYCGLVTDPVTRIRFQPRDDTPRIERDGRLFFFATDESRTAFQADPDSFAVPHLQMMPKAKGG